MSNWKRNLKRYGIPIVITLLAEGIREVYNTWQNEQYRKEDLRQAYRDVLEEEEERKYERRYEEFIKKPRKK